MSPAHQYKKIETKVAFDIVRIVKVLFRAVADSLKKIVQTGKQRYTIMLIPHSERKIFNFKMSLFSLIFLGILLAGILSIFLFYSTKFTGMGKLLTARSESLESSKASLEAIRDELSELRKTTTVFFRELTSTYSALGLGRPDSGRTGPAEGDLSYFYAIQEQDEGLIRELGDLRNLSETMLASIDVLKDINSILESQRDMLADLPTLWPVDGRIRITNWFGFAEHPITGITYLHKGIDIAKAPGVPILAAANGKVIERSFDKGGFGNMLMIRHKAGFITKYAHMDKVYVREGDTVVQGQPIGTMGNTGLSTGYHLHFEVRLGTQVMNPLVYLRLKDSINVTSGSR